MKPDAERRQTLRTLDQIDNELHTLATTQTRDPHWTARLNAWLDMRNRTTRRINQPHA